MPRAAVSLVAHIAVIGLAIHASVSSTLSLLPHPRRSLSSMVDWVTKLSIFEEGIASLLSPFTVD